MDKIPRKLLIIIVVLFLLFVIGIVVAFISASLHGHMSCGLLGCPCSEDGEKTCNTCYQKSAVFMLGFFNIFYECTEIEIITCENGEQVGKRMETDLENCGYRTYLFDIRIN